MISVPTIWTFKKGEHIAQLLLLNYVMPGKTDRQRVGGFGSTDPGALNNPLIAFVSNIKKNERPMLNLNINGKNMKGMFDTGADFSIISSNSWPSNWELQVVPHGLSGVGDIPASSVRLSAKRLKCIGPEEQVATVQPFVAPMPLNLWGRDLIEQWCAQISMPTNNRIQDSENKPF